MFNLYLLALEPQAYMFLNLTDRKHLFIFEAILSKWFYNILVKCIELGALK